MELKDITKEAICAPADTTFRDAVSLMLEKQTNVLLITDENNKLIGVASVTDLLDAVVPEYLDNDSVAAHFATPEMFESAIRESENKPIRDFMSTEISSVQADEGLMSVAVIAISNRRLRIPVVDSEGHPVGIISRQGLKRIIAEFLANRDSA